ncbi:O-antigen ligase family protein [Romboutsia hominis]|uniref:O-antigen ligase family protein n=1 Tax=Romboutsia hominis TaxID=1507512 RepID=UPI001F06C920|nr:O-antigen ligase family protein [Romboutsia hominis]MCH1960638.1 O-antigen ligase family protein [Romboutsia hominis]MCH1968930.1 O-antigen ligase family protein [Romboutsia hominis]
MECISLKNNPLYEKLLIFTLGLLPIIDSINGFVMSTTGISIGVIIRLFILILLFKYTYERNNFQRIIYISIFIFYFVFVSIYTFFIHQQVGGMAKELMSLSKLFFILLLIESYRNKIKDYKRGLKLIENIIDLNIILFPLCIIIPTILDVGLDVYSGGIGSKGFFNSNNEVAMALGILFIFSIDNLYKNTNLVNTIKILLIIISTILLSSKIGYAIPIVVTLIYTAKSLFRIKEKGKFLSYIAISFIIVAILLIGKYRYILMEMYKRQEYLKNISGSLVYVTLGGRNQLLAYMNEAFSNLKYNFIGIIFGIGMLNEQILLGKYLSMPLKLIEMDFFDLFYSYGIVGMLIVYGYFISIMYRYGTIKENGFKFTLALIAILTLGGIGGHVFWNAIGGSILAIVCCGMISQYKCVN